MRKPFKYFILIICLFHFSYILAQRNYEYKIQRDSNFSLKDIYAFKSAELMYLVADTLSYSGNADLILASVKKQIDKGKFLENAEVWNELIKLEPYRMNPKMVGEVNNISGKLSASIKKSKFKYTKNISVIEAKNFTSLYETIDYESFIEEGRKLLNLYPRNSDIRNNLALALIHTNKDLTAWIELETIRRLDSLHIPALLNLTVVYERLGMQKEAEKLANYLYEIQKRNKLKNPLILYNTGYYKYIGKNYPQVDSLLSEIGNVEIQKNAKIQKLKELNTWKMMKTAQFFEIGIMSKFGFNVEDDFFNWYFIIASIITLVVLIIFMVIKMSGKNSKIFLPLLFCCFILALVYIFAWGLPTADNWYYFAIYSLLPFILLIVISILIAMFSS
jgi:hypothetical protein